MLSERFKLGAKLVLGVLPIYYGAFLIAVLPNTWQWAAICGVVLLPLLVLCIYLGYPLQRVWPVFPGAFLIVACTCALSQGAFAQLPLTRQPIELFVMYAIGLLYFAWAARATWKAYSAY